MKISYEKELNLAPYNLTYKNVRCEGVDWEKEIFVFIYKCRKFYYKQQEYIHSSEDTDHIRWVIEEFLEQDLPIKQLYYYKIREFVNGDEYWPNHEEYSNLRYGIPKEMDNISVDNFDDFFNLRIATPKVRVDYTFFGNKVLKCRVTLLQEKTIRKRKFRSYEQRRELCFPEACNYTLNQLMDKLPASDFADWCLDYGLTIPNNIQKISK